MVAHKHEESDAGQGILEPVRNHAGTQALAQMSHDAKENAEDGNNDHIAPALVSVGQTEENSRNKDSDNRAVGQRLGLALQVSAKNDFLKQPGGDAENHKEPGFKITVRSQRAKGAHGFILRLLEIVKIDQAESDPEAKEQNQGSNEKSNGEPYIEQEFFHGIPAPADEVTYAHATEANPKPDQQDQHQFQDKGAAIEKQPRSMCSAADVFELG